MKEDIPIDRSEMDGEESFLQPEDIDEEIEIIDENELREINEDEDIDIDNANVGEGGEDYEDDDFVTDNEPPEENASLVFTRHKEAVLSICVSSTGDLVLSGGQDDRGLLWKTSTGEILFECSGHKDSVVCVGFSSKETYAATGDMSGLIQVWKIETHENVFTYEVEDLQWIRWHPVLDTVLVCGTESGNAWLFKVNDYTQIKTFPGPAFSNTAGQITSNGTKAVMGYDDGSVRFWDLKTASATYSIREKQAHTGTVTCIDIKSDDSLAASGSTDGTVKLINAQSGKVIHTFECGKGAEPIVTVAGVASSSETKDTSIESIAFCESLPVLATATVAGLIEVWDLSTFICRNSVTNPSGVSRLLWNPTETNLLHAAGLDGSLTTWDGRTGQLQSSLYGHRDQILDFAVSKTNNIIVTASEDSSCRVFEFRPKSNTTSNASATTN